MIPNLIKNICSSQVFVWEFKCGLGGHQFTNSIEKDTHILRLSRHWEVNKLLYMIRHCQVEIEEFIDMDGIAFVSVHFQLSVFFTQTQYEI